MADVVTFDPINLLITEIDAGGDNEIAWQEIYSEWKAWLLADLTRLGYPQAFRYVGADPISATNSLGTTFFVMNGWKVRPAERDHTLVLTGNAYVDGGVGRVWVPTVGAYTVAVEQRVSNLSDAALLSTPEIEYSAFGGGVTYDETSSYSGAAYPVGTPRAPVNNLADAMAILTERGFTQIYFIGDATIDNGGDYRGVVFIGESKSKSHVVITPSSQVDRCEFYDAHIEGTLDGDVVVRECVIHDLIYVDGYIERCILEPGTITLSGVKIAHFIDCWCGGTTLATAPVIDCGGTGSAVIVRNFNGCAKIQNKTGPEAVTMDLASASIVIDTQTVTAGLFRFAGVGQVLDQNLAPLTESWAPGVTLYTEQLISPESVARATWATADTGATAGTMAALVQAMVSGLTEQQATQLLELWRLNGLDQAAPLRVTSTARTVGAIEQTITEAGGVVTVGRTP